MSQTNFFKSGSSKKCCREYNISKKKKQIWTIWHRFLRRAAIIYRLAILLEEISAMPVLYATQVFCKTHSGILQKRKNFAQIKFS